MGIFDTVKNVAKAGYTPNLIGGGYKNPAGAANKYLSQIPGVMKPYYDPFINAGVGAIPGLQKQFGDLMNDPGGVMNKIGGGFQQSPGFQFALQQALQGAGRASAAGGMAGSPMHEQQNMGIATDLASQDYNNWMKNALGLYGIGLEGQQGFMNQGYNASNELAQSLANALMNRASLGYAGGANMNMNRLGEQGMKWGFLGNAARSAMGGGF